MKLSIQVWLLRMILAAVFMKCAYGHWTAIQITEVSQFGASELNPPPPKDAKHGEDFTMDDEKYSSALSKIGRSTLCATGQKYLRGMWMLQVILADTGQTISINAVTCFDSNSDRFWVKKGGSDYTVYYK